MATTLGLAFLAGLASTLSPCVLPLVPIVLATAAAKHRYGPLALATGLALSFVAIGLFVATIGFSAGIDERAFRSVGAVFMIAAGLLLLTPVAQARFAAAAAPVGDWAAERIEGVSGEGLAGQFAVGLLLGAVWSPCVGPTLGAASVLASRGENLGTVAVTMFVFGLGAAAPLAALGLASRALIADWRARLTAAGRSLRIALGVVLIAIGIAALSGYDKVVETALVEASPDWLTAFTTRF